MSLIVEIDQEFAWRMVEISTFFRVFEFSGGAQPVLIRSGIPLLYAHWEGFVKSSTDAYLRYVCNVGLRAGDVAPKIRMLQFWRVVNKFQQAQSIEQQLAGYERILAFPDTSFRRLPRDVTNTRSNLSSVVLEEIMQSAGLDHSIFAVDALFIDKKLLERRNHIAHGRALEVDRDEFVRLKDGVVRLLRAYKNEIENSLAEKRYRVAVA